MKLSFEGVRALSTGVWVGDIDSSELKVLMTSSTKEGEVSVLSVFNPEFDRLEGRIQVPLNGLEVLVNGSSKRAFFVDQTAPSNPTGPGNPGTGGAGTVVQHSGQFGRFLTACRNEGISTELTELIERLLTGIGRKFPFSLKEGKARKWTADPNFVAITIQNRNRQFLVSVKGDHRRMNYRTIHPVAGRGLSYSEFHFNSAEQYDEALDAILKSAGY